MIFKRIKYQIKRKGSFHLHSPFVYSFYMTVLKKMPYHYEKELKRRALEFCEKHQDIMNGGEVFIINNIHKNKKSERMWKQLVADPQYTISIDCYRYGILFKMPRLVKQHFVF